MDGSGGHGKAESLKWLSWMGVLALVMWLGGAGAARAEASRTLAIWDFDNNTVAGLGAITEVDYMTRALPEMILAHLNGVSGLQVVERVHLREALEEQKLGSSDLADEDARLKLGRIVGAQDMVFGSFMLLGEELRVDIRVVEVATTLTLMAEAGTGKAGDLSRISKKLAESIVKKLTKGGVVSASGPEVAPEVLARYDQGIQLMDAHKYDQAVELFQGLLKANPGFVPAEKQITLALERMARQ